MRWGRQNAASSRVLLAWEQHRDGAQRQQPGSGDGSWGMDASVPAWMPRMDRALLQHPSELGQPHKKLLSEGKGQSPISGRKAQP